MPTGQLGPNIQVNEKVHCSALSLGHLNHGDCGSKCRHPYTYQIMDGVRDWAFVCDQCDFYWDKCSDRVVHPKRCSDCNKDFMRWKRTKLWINKLVNNFDYKRHRFPKMITFALPGKKHFNSVSHYRSEMTKRFNRLRKRKFWKKYVDGGFWFFECTLKRSEDENPLYPTMDDTQSEIVRDFRSTGSHNYQLHPHFHCLILGPKKIPLELLNQELSSLGFGRANITVPRDKNGNLVHCARREDLIGVIGYATNYLKKPGQFEGRNRGAFGCLTKS